MSTPSAAPSLSAPPPPGPPWWRTLRREHWGIFAIGSLAWLFDCLNQQMFNLARDGAVERLIHDPRRVAEYASYTTSFFLTGWAVGGVIFGAVGDKFGRIRCLGAVLLLYAVCTAAGAFVGSYAGFCLCLAVTGLGVGGVFGLSVAAIAEAVPAPARAPLLGWLQTISGGGNVLAGLLGLGIGIIAAHHLLPGGLKTWQALFLVGSVPAALCAVPILRRGEPAEWLRRREAGRRQGVRFGSYGRLLGERRWSGHAWLGLLLCCAGIVGLWGLGNFHPKIIRAIVDAHFAGAALSADALAAEKAHWTSLALLLQNLGGMAGVLSLAKFAQVKGRRPAAALALVLSFLSTQLVFRYLTQFSQIYWMLPLMGFGQYSIFGIYAIYLPELFPTSLRSTGVSFCYNFGRLAAATAPFTLGRLTSRLGGNVAAFRTAGLWVSSVLLLGLLALPFLPETAGRPLPEDQPLP